ncbi:MULTISPECIES: TonB-dependent receptor [unclassified Pseudoalteromonas]|uniref:TonB-dependent receptor n=1 Tax=unclassified Pseudoalteromonas TaxID=194690 RepID=UPI002097D284|nr:TonB-dependent receptor [Pseudoalteromonas sp. XMcav2-N]MCO7190702.1 TonB-dependent receptor [Pseudoalteromonas sp. XMcav2-N]
MNPLKYSLLPLALAVSNAVMADDSKEDLKSIEQIVVYGENTQRSLKDTTSSIAVIDQEQLKSGQVNSLLDALSGIANVVFTDSLPTIRGLQGEGVSQGFSSFSSGAKPRVSVMRDGVSDPFVAKLSGDFGLWDVEQIEVLRGPQSSNSGRNSIGGIVYIKTKEPSLTDFEAATRIGYSDLNENTELSGMVSVPLLEDQLALRATVQRNEGESYMDYKGTSPLVVYPFNPKELEDTRMDIKLKWQPAALSGLDMLLHYSRSEETGERHWGFQGPVLNGNDPENTKIGPQLSDRVVSYQVVPTPAGPVAGSYARDKDTEYDRWSLRTRYEISDAINLEIMLSDTDYRYEFRQYPEPWYVIMNDSGKTYDAKVSFAGNETVSGYLGLYMNDRDQTFFREGYYKGTDDSENQAIYGEATIKVSEQGRVVVGGRIEDEEQYRLFDGAEMAKRFGMPNIEFVIDVDNRIYLPKLAYLHDLNDNITVNASFRKGYSSGGGDFHWFSMSNYTFEPEYVDTFEVGLRSTLMDGDLNFAVNVFYNDFEDYQYYGTGPTGNPNDFSIINLAKVKSAGFETEARYAINPDLTLSASFGWMDSTVDEANAENPTVRDKALPMAADITAGLGLEFWATDKLQLTARSNYVGEYYSKLGEKAEHLAGDYAEFHFSAAYVEENWRIDAYVNNAFDHDSLISAGRVTGSDVFIYGDYTDPRNMGISFSYTF